MEDRGQSRPNEVDAEWQAAPGSERANIERAAGVTHSSLGMWRTRFVGGKEGQPVGKTYPMSNAEQIIVHSSAPGQVEVQHQRGEAMVTTYTYDENGAELLRVQQQIGEEPPQEWHGGDVMQFDSLNRLLFMCDRLEARG